MMVNAANSPDEGLAEFLTTRARSASDGRLMLDVAVGLLAALALGIWHPRSWIVVFAMGIALASFGAWGLADREIAERTNAAHDRLTRPFRVLRGFALATGAVAAVVACVTLFGTVLGTWIS